MEKQLEDLLMDLAKGEQGSESPEGQSDVTESGEVTEDNTTSEVSGEDPNESSEVKDQDTEDSGEAQGVEESSEGSLEEGEEEDELIELDFDEEDEEDDVPAFADFVKELDVEGVEDAKSLKELITTLKSENTELKTKVVENPVDKLPEKYREAIELSGGNPEDLLQMLEIQAVDYDAINPADLAEMEIKQYFMKDGQFDEEGFIDYIDTVPEKELEIAGMRRQRELKAQQAARLQQLKDRQAARIAQENAALEAAITKMDRVDAFKVTDSQKTRLKNELLNGNWKNVLTPKTKDGRVDYNSLAELVFLKNNYKAMIKALKTATRNDQKREVIQEIGNHQPAGNADKRVHQPDGKIDPMDLFIQTSKERSAANSISTLYEQLNKK